MKIVLPSAVSGYNLQVINNNFQSIASELQHKVLYRDNTSGEANVMENDLDMNSNSILNVRNLDISGSLRANGVNFSAVNSAFVWRGVWDDTTSYAVSDAVAFAGSSYIATSANTNSTPPSADWDLLAAAGVVGGVDLATTTGTLSIPQGGTGQTTASAARAALGAADASAFSAFGYSFGALTDDVAARTSLGLIIGTNIPSVTGTGAYGSWSIGILGNAATATYATTAGNGGVTSFNGRTGAVVTTDQNSVGYIEALLYAVANGPLSSGTNYPGSLLRRGYTPATDPYTAVTSITGTPMTGTWRCLASTLSPGGGVFSISNFMRVS